MQEGITPKGKTYITTELGDVVSTEQTVGHLVLSNGTRVQVKRAWVAAASNATTTLLAQQTGKLYRILSLFMLAGSTAAQATFNSYDGSTTTAITPPFTNAANGGAVLPPNLWGWFQTLQIGDALTVTVDNTSNVSVLINYIELTDDLFDLL